MKKIYHNSMHDWAVPKNLTDPVHVLTSHVSFDEVAVVVKQKLKALIPFMGRYQLAVEFTEPSIDPRFVLGHVGAVISVYAETAEEAEEMLKVLSK